MANQSLTHRVLIASLYLPDTVVFTHPGLADASPGAAAATARGPKAPSPKPDARQQPGSTQAPPRQVINPAQSYFSSVNTEIPNPHASAPRSRKSSGTWDRPNVSSAPGGTPGSTTPGGRQNMIAALAPISIIDDLTSKSKINTPSPSTPGEEGAIAPMTPAVVPPSSAASPLFPVSSASSNGPGSAAGAGAAAGATGLPTSSGGGAQPRTSLERSRSFQPMPDSQIRNLTMSRVASDSTKKAPSAIPGVPGVIGSGGTGPGSVTPSPLSSAYGGGTRDGTGMAGLGSNTNITTATTASSIAAGPLTLDISASTPESSSPRPRPVSAESKSAGGSVNSPSGTSGRRFGRPPSSTSSSSLSHRRSRSSYRSARRSRSRDDHGLNGSAGPSGKLRSSGRHSSVSSRGTVDTLEGADALSLPEADGERAEEVGWDWEWHIAPNPAGNVGLQNAVNAVKGKLRENVWIGTLGVETDEWDAELLGDVEKSLWERRSSVPVLVDAETWRGAYDVWCKQIAWPTFHYTIPDVPKSTAALATDAFERYEKLNRAFADKIIATYRNGDIVWVNDYHLLLVPRMVRDALPHAIIGFFLHIAFPSSEIFRCLPGRATILHGMLGSDTIGFQTTSFARHFRQTVSRILQLEATPKGIQLDERFVHVGAFPIGIDFEGLKMKRAEPEVQECVEFLRERYAGKKLVVGRDKLDWVKGVRQKLLAFELFLEENPEFQGEVVLVQVAIATTEENEKGGEVSDVVARINHKFSTFTYQPVVFLHVQDMTFSQYLALLTVADAFFACSLREGMNLTSHEFVVCQEKRHRPLILSEFTGTYSSFRACITINPWNTVGVAKAIRQALTMSDQEAKLRWHDLYRTVRSQTAQHWVLSLLSRLERAHAEKQRRDALFIPRLEPTLFSSEWRASKTRLVLLDLEGTLVLEDVQATRREGFVVPERVADILRQLCADERNKVFCLSGKSIQDLTRLGDLVPGLGLCAENGCFLRMPHETNWISMVAGISLGYREPVKEILNYFTERTPGSFIEDRGASICWRFLPGGEKDKNDAAWARRQAAEVQNLIYDSLSERFSLHIIPGKHSFLVMPKNTSRATAVAHVLQVGAMGGINSPTSGIGLGSPSSTVVPHPHYFAASSHNGASAGGGLIGGGLNMMAAGGGATDTFDCVLAISEDERLISLVNGLDLPFAPLSCTTTKKGSEASFQLEGGDVVLDKLAEVLEFRARDERWGGPEMSDV